jgi:LDH2 family malate/lactate/ureidoglycolate dehydrogenase
MHKISGEAPTTEMHLDTVDAQTLTNATLRVHPARLVALIGELLRATGLPEMSARIVGEALVDADCAGLPSHGAMLVPLYVERLRAGSVSLEESGRIASDRGSAIVIDAQNALGQLTSRQAVGLLTDRAPRHGLAAVAVRNAFHFGAAGYWAAGLARQGLVGVAMCNTRPLMPAPGGAERVVGNNPLAIAVPAAGNAPLVLDMALSTGAMGKIRLAAAVGESIPQGWATDGRGTPTTNAVEAIKGMLLPAGGAKGFGLAFMIDLLCGGLAGGAIGEAVRPLYGDPREPYGCAHLFVAIDVAHFRELSDFAAVVTGFANRVRESAPAPDQLKASVPGDRAALARLANADGCPLAADTVRALASLASTLGIASDGLFS